MATVFTTQEAKTESICYKKRKRDEQKPANTPETLEAVKLVSHQDQSNKQDSRKTSLQKQNWSFHHWNPQQQDKKERTGLHGVLWEHEKCLPEHGTEDQQLYFSHVGKAM